MLLWALTTSVTSNKHNSKFEVKLTFAYKSDLCRWQLNLFLPLNNFNNERTNTTNYKKKYWRQITQLTNIYKLTNHSNKQTNK